MKKKIDNWKNINMKEKGTELETKQNKQKIITEQKGKLNKIDHPRK